MNIFGWSNVARSCWHGCKERGQSDGECGGYRIEKRMNCRSLRRCFRCLLLQNPPGMRSHTHPQPDECHSNVNIKSQAYLWVIRATTIVSISSLVLLIVISPLRSIFLVKCEFTFFFIVLLIFILRELSIAGNSGSWVSLDTNFS